MDATDEIVLTGVRAFGHHGVYAHERRDGQEFVVDLTLSVDTRRAAETDEVTDTIHYGEVAERVVELVGAEPVNLLERLAARIADDLLTRDGVAAVTVTVHKPAAPIPVPFADVAVTIRRTAPHASMPGGAA
ncbi:dihydroneopterin aldolase [Microbacterium dextranolyticum]|uniref:7,8-dihydroneopterin aldolase n=1 Tax=Microbacterium dextranolyticum TaxID=36806 RepID=A0A9W6HMJ3_9MICO|nr:dihydroneopterin aldolase [Microbacterium dextranolyticum]MBM7464269.1 dihydroneopterin aldolase [Microbacterium dextranolyticum]GLJ95263.1 7,8-dihydroneopterin aldolase [Microbacterium dextranolyticum]